MTLSDSELRVVGPKLVRKLTVTELRVASDATTFTLGAAETKTPCRLDGSGTAQRIACAGEPAPFALRELHPGSDDAEIASIEQQLPRGVEARGSQRIYLARADLAH